MLTLVLTAITLEALRGAVGRQSQAVIRSTPLDYIVLEGRDTSIDGFVFSKWVLRIPG